MVEVSVPAGMESIIREALQSWKPKKEKDKVKPCTGCDHLHPENKIPCGIVSTFCANSDNKPHWLNPVTAGENKKL